MNCVTLGMYQPCDDMDCLSDRCKILQVRPWSSYLSKPRPSILPALPTHHCSSTMPRPPTMPRPTTSMSPPCPALQNHIPTTWPALSQLAVFFLTPTWSYSFPLVILSPLHPPYPSRGLCPSPGPHLLLPPPPGLPSLTPSPPCAVKAWMTLTLLCPKLVLCSPVSSLGIRPNSVNGSQCPLGVGLQYLPFISPVLIS